MSIISKRCLRRRKGFRDFTAYTAILSRRSGNLTSLKGIELLENVGEFRLGFFDDFRRGALERLFGGDAVEPALLGQFFVTRKVEADEQLYGAAVLILGFVGF